MHPDFCLFLFAFIYFVLKRCILAESDNESAPTNSPIKSSNKRIVKVKTWEEIKLERIQAESAALYSYPERESAADDLRQRILGRLRQSDDAVKRKMEVNLNAPSSKRQKVTDVNKIKIKTLDEIRAERTRKFEKTSPTICDNLVSSTQDIVHHKKDKNTKIKLQRAPAAYVEEYKNDDFVSAEGGAHTQENSLSDGECDVEGDTLMKTSKTTADEVLLLQDDDENSNVSLKDEERLLNDLDEFLED